MKSFLKNLFGKTKSSKIHKATDRRVRLGVESLEDRRLMTFDVVGGLGSVLVGEQAAIQSPVQSEITINISGDIDPVTPGGEHSSVPIFDADYYAAKTAKMLEVEIVKGIIDILVGHELPDTQHCGWYPDVGLTVASGKFGEWTPPDLPADSEPLPAPSPEPTVPIDPLENKLWAGYPGASKVTVLEPEPVAEPVVVISTEPVPPSSKNAELWGG